MAGDDFAREFPSGAGKCGSDGELFPWFDQTAPGLISAFGMKQKTLDLAAGGALRVEAGGQDGRVVANQRIARSQELR